MNIHVGDCELELGPLCPNLNDKFTMDVKQTLSFKAEARGKEFLKGQFNVTLALVDSYAEPTHSGMTGD